MATKPAGPLRLKTTHALYGYVALAVPFGLGVPVDIGPNNHTITVDNDPDGVFNVESTASDGDSAIEQVLTDANAAVTVPDEAVYANGQLGAFAWIYKYDSTSVTGWKTLAGIGNAGEEFGLLQLGASLRAYSNVGTYNGATGVLHVGVSFDGTDTWKLFVDGALVDTVTSGPKTINGSLRCVVGDNTTEPAPGLVCDARWLVGEPPEGDMIAATAPETYYDAYETVPVTPSFDEAWVKRLRFKAAGSAFVKRYALVDIPFHAGEWNPSGETPVPVALKDITGASIGTGWMKPYELPFADGSRSHGLLCSDLTGFAGGIVDAVATDPSGVTVPTWSATNVPARPTVSASVRDDNGSNPTAYSTAGGDWSELTEYEIPGMMKVYRGKKRFGNLYTWSDHIVFSGSDQDAIYSRLIASNPDTTKRQHRFDLWRVVYGSTTVDVVNAPNSLILDGMAPGWFRDDTLFGLCTDACDMPAFQEGNLARRYALPRDPAPSAVSAYISSWITAHQTKLDNRADWKANYVLGPNSGSSDFNPNGTGFKRDHGVLVGSQMMWGVRTNESALDMLPILMHNALDWSLQASHHVESATSTAGRSDGDMVRAGMKTIPGRSGAGFHDDWHCFPLGYTHWNTSASTDRLGKTNASEPFLTSGYSDGEKTTHVSCNLVPLVARMTRAPFFIDELRFRMEGLIGMLPIPYDPAQYPGTLVGANTESGSINSGELNATTYARSFARCITHLRDLGEILNEALAIDRCKDRYIQTVEPKLSANSVMGYLAPSDTNVPRRSSWAPWQELMAVRALHGIGYTSEASSLGAKMARGYRAADNGQFTCGYYIDDTGMGGGARYVFDGLENWGLQGLVIAAASGNAPAKAVLRYFESIRGRSQAFDETNPSDVTQGNTVGHWLGPMPLVDGATAWVEWAKRVDFTFASSQITATEYSKSYRISGTIAGMVGVAKSDGTDLVFADAKGNLLPFLIEEFTAATGYVQAVVKIPVLPNDTDTVVRCYFGNASSADWSQATYTPTNVGVYTWTAASVINNEVTEFVRPGRASSESYLPDPTVSNPSSDLLIQLGTAHAQSTGVEVDVTAGVEIDASYVTGPAPLGVHFRLRDPELTTDTAQNRLYRWRFGDPTSSYNRLDGPSSTHQFDAPGTYLVTVECWDDTGLRYTRQKTITVTDEDASYPGDATICFSNDDDHTGHPDGAQLISNVTDFESALSTYLAPGKRLQFRYGDTYTTSGASTVDCAGATVGAFGDDAGGFNEQGVPVRAPIIECAAAPLNGETRNAVRVTGAGVRVRDLRFVETTAHNSFSSPVSSPYPIDGLHLYRVLSEGFSVGSGIGWDICNHYAEPGRSGSPYYQLGHDRYFLGGCTSLNARTNNFYGGSLRMGIVGCGFYTSVGSHVVRVNYAPEGVLAYCDVFDPGGTRHALKWHSNQSHAAFGDTQHRPVITKNHFRGARAWLTVLGPQDSIKDERIAGAVVDSNLFEGLAGTQRLMFVGCTDTCIRNNVFWDRNLGGGGYDFVHCHIERRGIEPTPTGLRFLHNSCFSDQSTHSRIQMLQIWNGGHSGDVVAKNNILHRTGSGTLYEAGLNNGAGFDVEGNMVGTDPLWENPGSGIFKLNANSPAIGFANAADVPVFGDYQGVLRD